MALSSLERGFHAEIAEGSRRTRRKMHVSEINIYPIKSLKGISLDSAKVEERGLEFDRRWMLTTTEGIFFTQREFPRMATITTKVMGDGLLVMSPDLGEQVIPFEPDRGERQMVTVWQSLCEGLVYKGVVNEWFSDVLKTKCQLVYMPDRTERHINSRFDRGNDIVSFADGYPLMVIGQASLDDLNRRLEEKFEIERERILVQDPDGFAEAREFQPLPMNRFRPNVVLADSKPYAEDNWIGVRMGEAFFRSTKPCERCVMTTVEQSTGEFDGKEPLRTLASYRMAKTIISDRLEELGVGANAVLFGQNLIVNNPGAQINVGDEVSETEK